jgi:hypothetical protein
VRKLYTSGEENRNFVGHVFFLKQLVVKLSAQLTLQLAASKVQSSENKLKGGESTFAHAPPVRNRGNHDEK